MAISARQVATQCYGLGGSFRILGDIFGYSVAPKALSVKRQLELAKGEACRGINLILVGSEDFSSSDLRKIEAGVQFARDIYAKVNLGIRRVSRWYPVPKSQAGGFAIIDSEDEADDLMDAFYVDNNLLDVFFVKDITDDFVGKVQDIDGPCDKPDKDGGILCSLEGGAGFFGNTVAHEIGHFLGLEHDGSVSNFMGNSDGNSNSSTGISSGQGNCMKEHCSVTGC